MNSVSYTTIRLLILMICLSPLACAKKAETIPVKSADSASVAEQTGEKQTIFDKWWVTVESGDSIGCPNCAFKFKKKEYIFCEEQSVNIARYDLKPNGVGSWRTDNMGDFGKRTAVISITDEGNLTLKDVKRNQFVIMSPATAQQTTEFESREKSERKKGDICAKAIECCRQMNDIFATDTWSWDCPKEVGNGTTMCQLFIEGAVSLVKGKGDAQVPLKCR